MEKVTFNRSSTISKVVVMVLEKNDTQHEWKPKQILLLSLLHLEYQGRHVLFTPLLFKYHTFKKIKHWKLNLEE